MESYRMVRTLTEIKEHTENGRNREAYELIQQLNVKKVRSVQDLNMLAQVCTRTEHYEEALSITLSVYERTASRRALAQLIELSIKLGRPVEAEGYLSKYEVVAPSDPLRLVFRFRIYKMMQEPLEEQLAVLEQWKSEEYAERWAYELAKLYHKMGAAEACVRECNDIVLWFGAGKYVEWAKVLRAYHTGEVDMETLRRYQEQVAPVATSDSGAKDDENVIREGKIQEAPLAEEQFQTAEEYLPSAEEHLSPEEEALLSEEVPSSAEEDFDDEAVSSALISSVEELSGFSRVNYQGNDQGHALGHASSPKLPSQAEQEEAIRFMHECLGDLGTRHVVNLKGEVESRYQPEEGGALEAMLYERELRLEDLFGNFARMDETRKQIVRSLDIIFAPLKRGNNLIISGGPASGKTELAKKIIKMLYRFQVLSATRVAIIDAEKLNQMKLEEKQKTLSECCLVVERAGGMNAQAVEKLLTLNAMYAGKSIVFLEDDRKSINRLLRDYAELNGIFNNRIHLPEEYRASELKGFVFDYLIEKEYEIDVYAEELLEKRIQMMLGAKSTNPIRDSIAIGKEAIKKAEKRAARNLTQMAATGNYENADIMVLHEEDFIA